MVVCICQNFALLEATVLLATTIKNFDLKLADKSVVTDGFIVPVRPKGGLNMFVSKRSEQ